MHVVSMLGVLTSLSGGSRTMLFLPLALTLASAAVPQHHAPAEGAPAEPAALFRSRCLACHVPPDPRFAVERAWLEQVLDTA